ncbi:MAG: OmpA family protein, partial [Bacteroidota bacterium]
VRNASNIYETLYSVYKDSLPEDFYFKYADALKGVKKYYKSDVITSTYLGRELNTEDLRKLLETVVPFTYEIDLLQSFDKTAAFSAHVKNDELIFASPASNAIKKYKWNDQPYLDLFKGTLSDENTLDSIVPYSNQLNSKSHESSVAITKNGQTIYFSRTDPERHRIDGINVATVKIYKATWNGNDWDEIEMLPFSSDFYSVQHPVLNSEENRLYFSSDMPESIGSFDIYYVDILGGDSFSDPINLGPTINTEYREQYPFVDTDNTLYFSSNGHVGFGGLDIFLSKWDKNSYLTPLNLGEIMNSSRDDFAYTHGRNDEEGFLSSNRGGVDQIYRFERESKDREYVIQGLVLDVNSQIILPETQVTLYDENGSTIATVISDQFGRYELPTKPNKFYSLEAFKPLYIPSRESFNTNDSGDITFNIELEIESYDDAEDIVIEKEDGYTYIELENIYFDYNRWEIKPEAARTLDVLVDLLNKYPRMEIELGAHTDSRATPSYNLALSQKRADAAMDYIVSKGVELRRIQAKGYGETQPLVDCGDKCSDVEYSINRRCEFIIIK